MSHKSRAQGVHVELLEPVSNENRKEHGMKYRAITFASAAFFVTSLALAGDTWILDSNKSNGRLFQCSRTNSELVNTGIARVTGKVKLDTNDLDASFFDLSIYPTDEDWGYALSPEGTLPTGYVPGSTDQTLLDIQVHAHSEHRERHIGSHRRSYIDSRGTRRHSDPN